MEQSLTSCKRSSKVAAILSSKIRSRRQRHRRGVAVPSNNRSVEMKVRKLQRLIPGGEGLRPELLFSRTADYISQLRLQVHVLQALSKIYGR
ncbi:hypothetical protein SAY87_001696 [Trapa incisa]|uniref:Uncharacterized protein n=1 Tax=Trapa incisa TaxID=236973 RepID=A0AAN7JUJ2_9MYRT|nr:hypothetical protein SAY87_001696 [Trapa incisa]